MDTKRAVSGTCGGARITNFERSRELRDRAHQLIPAGAHTYSKGDDQFPYDSPGFIERGQGCYLYDVDGNEYVDWGMGLRAVILGHCYPRVIDAVTKQLHLGANFTLPSPIELELAELLVELIPSAEMVKFAKNGSDVTSAALRLARAYTGRDLVAISRDTPFYSFDDWFIGITPCNSGIPRQVQELTLTFSYNDIVSLENLFAQHPGRIAAVILEPVTVIPPAEGFLEDIKHVTHKHGAVLIFDEIITGFRWHLSGAQAYFGVTPDLSTFGKAMGNGFSVAALVGRRDIMELGGTKHQKEKVFLLSSTHGGETHAIAAAIATIQEIRERDVIGHIWKIGQELQQGINALAYEAGLEGHIVAEGYPCIPYIRCKDPQGDISFPFTSLFQQEMIAHGVLMPHTAVSFSHTPVEVEQTLEAVRDSMEVYRLALEAGGVDKYLVGPPSKPVFRRYN